MKYTAKQQTGETAEKERLSAQKIRLALSGQYKDREICVFPCLDSTNQEVKRRAKEAEEGLVVLAEEQTAGRGRLGRRFFSPAETGIYMSVLFHPGENRQDHVVLITTAASVAVCRAIRRLTKEEPKIKWVNDIYLSGKKICGILAEAVCSPDSGQIESVVVGIGINCTRPQDGFPEELREVAGVVGRNGQMVSRNLLAAAVLEELWEIYENLKDRTFMEDYRRWSCVLGREVRFTSGTVWESATAVDVDEDGSLIVQSEQGEKWVLRTGEITLRLEKGEA